MAERRSTRVAPVQRRAHATREAIVRAYIEAAARAGHANVTLETVRQLALTSTATTYRYFRNVEELQRQVFSDYLQQLRGFGSSAAGGGAGAATARAPIERFKRLLDSSRAAEPGVTIVAGSCVANDPAARASLQACADEIAIALGRATSSSNVPAALLQSLRVAVRLCLLWHLYDETGESDLRSADAQRTQGLSTDDLIAALERVVTGAR